MQYSLTEIDEIPKGWGNRAPPGFYNDIIKVFLETGYKYAKVTVPGRNPDVVARRLDTRVDDEIGVRCIGDAVYLENHSLTSSARKQE